MVARVDQPLQVGGRRGLEQRAEFVERRGRQQYVVDELVAVGQRQMPVCRVDAHDRRVGVHAFDRQRRRDGSPDCARAVLRIAKHCVWSPSGALFVGAEATNKVVDVDCGNLSAAAFY